MDNRNPWYPQNHPNYRRNDGHSRHPNHQQQGPNNSHTNTFTNAANQTVHSAQQLLASYPMASATPTMHTVRHLSSLNMTAAPPSIVQPSYYSSQPHTAYPAQQNLPPTQYTEYDQQLSYLASPTVPQAQANFWQGARDQSVRLLNEQATRSYPYQERNQHTWTQSSYQSTPFAQSVFQRTPSSSAYPTPPPPGISTSSSSLAFALGSPGQNQVREPQPQPQSQYAQHQHQPQPQHFQLQSQPQHAQHVQLQPQPSPQPRVSAPIQQPPGGPSVHATVYRAEDSGTFFNEFLERKTRDMEAAKPPTAAARFIPPPKKQQPMPVPVAQRPRTPAQKPPMADSSPDPLALKSVMSPPSVTPQKRKPVVEIQSPSHKRLQAYKPLLAAQLPTNLRTPQSSVPRTPTSKRIFPTAPPSHTTPSSTSITTMASTPSRATVPMTPTPNRIGRNYNQSGDTPDLGGYGSNEDTPLRVRLGFTSAKRTGDRDDRIPLEKFATVVDEIFEAEDALPAEMERDELPQEYFSTLSTDCTRPMLKSAIIRKLLKYIGQVSRPTKRMRQVGVSAGGVLSTPRSKAGRMADVDAQTLSRLLKVLDRSVKAGEDVDPFQQIGSLNAASSSGTVSARSSPVKKGSRKSKKGKEVAEDDDAMEGIEEGDDIAKNDTPTGVLDEIELEKLNVQLDLSLDSILAADCCMAILASDRLPKQLYSEELITSCLNAVKNQLTKVLYPFVEGASPDSLNAKMYNSALQHLVKNAGNDPNPLPSATASQSSHRKQMHEIFQALSSVLPRINALANAESVAMSDSIIIQAVYIAIGPFFVVESGSDDVSKGGKKEKENVVNRTLGKSAMRALRLDALSLIRSIFANHEDQRSWIIEEILSSLIKLSDTKQKAGQFRLRDGRSIRTVSALLLQLVQTSAHDVRTNARRLEKERQNKLTLKRQESFSESQNAQPDEPFLDELDTDEIRLYGSGLDSATKAAKTIILFLNSRSGKGKATKNSNEAEYRAIFDNLIDDLLVVLYWPEWPAASLLLSIASKFMVSSLDDVKSSAQTDSNAAKTMALDHLGVIAAQIRSSVLKVQKGVGREDSEYRDLKSLDEIVASQSTKQFAKLMEAHRDVAAHLCKRSSEDQAYDSARELTAAILGQELAAALKQVNVWLDHPEEDDDLNLKDPKRLLPFGQKVKLALREVWKDPSTDVFDSGSQEEISRIDRLSEEIGSLQSLKHSFQPIVNVILMALDAPPIFMRTKALRALGQIVTSDATILATSNVRRGIESHLLDSSPAVRDAAVELIGKYMIDSPEVASDYYPKIAERMADTGLGVRKRVIKLLKSFYAVTEDTQRKIDICSRLVLRMMDEDDGVKDLAIKTLEELWFPPVPLLSAMKNRANANNPNQEKAALLNKVSIIMGTAAYFRDKNSPLEDILHKIMAEKEGSEAALLHNRYTEICEALIDGLVDATDLPGFTIFNCVRTIHLFTSAYPPVLSGTYALTLLPYLKNAASSQEEIYTTDYLLKIFRVSIPHMPKTAKKFGLDLQSSLQSMIMHPKGPAGMTQILQECVSCICTVVQQLTHDFQPLINLLSGCNRKLLLFLNRPSNQLAANEGKAVLALVYIVALLGEHCPFDRLRLEHQNLAASINSVSQTSVMEHIYNTILRVYGKYSEPSVRNRLLQCLGFLFRAQPTLMTKEESASVMDAVFDSTDEEPRSRLLKILQDFLISESEKHSAKEKESLKNKNAKVIVDVNMEELVGNTDGFADSGVSSAIVQRYLSHILEAALSQNSQIQAAAIDVLTFTIKQGLAHPLQSFPIIIALETSPVSQLSSRAIALHSILNSKHASLLNTRYSISARKSFDYQKKIVPEGSPIHGYRAQGPPVALLQRWYSLVREKRATRQDFLKALVKVFSEGESYNATQDDVDFTRYMAENFASFEYKTQEEVFTVIKYLTSVLSTTGMQLLDVISPSHLLSHLHSSSQQPMVSSQSSMADGPPDSQTTDASTTTTTSAIGVYGGRDAIPLMRSSIIIAMVMLLKAHLKILYSLSEDKCNKFVIGKKSAIGDKPAMKKHDRAISWDKLPYAVTPIHTTHDAEQQKIRFLEIWNEDGVTAEPEDDEFL